MSQSLAAPFFSFARLRLPFKVHPLGLLCGFLLLLMLTSLLVGAGEIGVLESLAYLLGQPSINPAAMHTALWGLRLPRTLAAVLVGSGLGVAGLMMQTVTRNALAEPGLLGINGGAALGVVLGITLSGAESGPAYLLWAALGALIGHLCVLVAAYLDRHVDAPLRLILAGAALSSLFHGLTTAVLLNQANGYDQYRFWILGSLTSVSLDMLVWASPVLVTGLLCAFGIAHSLSALSLGDDMAHALGHNPQRQRLFAASIVTLLSGCAVALTGPIAFLGLLAPFFARRCRDGSPLTQMFYAAAWGAILLLGADIAARCVIRPFEAPVSVMTALLGAPVLVWMARTQRWELRS